METIKGKLMTRSYYSVEECVKDFELMFSNCYIYNPPQDAIVRMAKKLQEKFRACLAYLPNIEIEIQVLKVQQCLIHTIHRLRIVILKDKEKR